MDSDDKNIKHIDNLDDLVGLEGFDELEDFEDFEEIEEIEKSKDANDVEIADKVDSGLFNATEKNSESKDAKEDDTSDEIEYIENSDETDDTDTSDEIEYIENSDETETNEEAINIQEPKEVISNNTNIIKEENIPRELEDLEDFKELKFQDSINDADEEEDKKALKDIVNIIIKKITALKLEIDFKNIIDFKNTKNIKKIIIIVLGIIITVNLVRIFLIKHSQTKEIKEQEKINMASPCDRDVINKQLKEAILCYGSAIDKDTHPRIKFNYINTLIAYDKKFNAIAYLEKMLKNTDQDETTISYAKEILADLKAKRYDAGDYFAELEDWAVWENPKKIKVYIGKSRKYNNVSLYKKAFAQWEETLSGLVGFEYVRNPKKAQIRLNTVDIDEITDSDGIGSSEPKGYFYNTNKNKMYLSSVDIKIAKNNKDGKNRSNEELYAITLHEIGHALGIISHSNSKRDIMYFDTSNYSRDVISKRDINTLKRMYGNY